MKHKHAFKVFNNLKIFFSVIVFSFASIGFSVNAEEVGINVDKINTDSNTTISIQKGSKTTGKTEYQITEGEDTIEGEPDNLARNARKNWKTACTEWKKEIKDLNKENKLIAVSCGTSSCNAGSMETICSSKGTYKVRVKVVE